MKDGESELPLIINGVFMHSLSENKGMRVLEMNDDDDDDENLDLLGDFKS